MTAHTFPMFLKCRECGTVHVLVCEYETEDTQMGCSKCCGGELVPISREEALKDPRVAENIHSLDLQAESLDRL